MARGSDGDGTLDPANDREVIRYGSGNSENPAGWRWRSYGFASVVVWPVSIAVGLLTYLAAVRIAADGPDVTTVVITAVVGAAPGFVLAILALTRGRKVGANWAVIGIIVHIVLNPILVFWVLLIIVFSTACQNMC